MHWLAATYSSPAPFVVPPPGRPGRGHPVLHQALRIGEDRRLWWRPTRPVVDGVSAAPYSAMAASLFLSTVSVAKSQPNEREPRASAS